MIELRRKCIKPAWAIVRVAVCLALAGLLPGCGPRLVAVPPVEPPPTPTAAPTAIPSAQAFLERGMQARAREDRQAALDAFNRAIELASDEEAALLADAYVQRATLRLEEHDLEGGLADLTQALEVQPSAEIYLRRSVVWNLLGNHEAMAADCTRAIELASQSAQTTQSVRLTAQAYLNRGLAHMALSDTAQAVSDFTHAIELNPANGWAYFERGMAYRQMGRKADAKSDLEKAAELGIVLSDEVKEELGIGEEGS